MCIRDSGWLDQTISSPIPLEFILLSKSIAYWLLIIIPLLISLPFFIILLNISLKLIPWLFISILIGGLSISLIGIIGSALTLGAKRGNILLPILIIPFIIPILIFGVGVSEAISVNESPIGNLFLLIGFTLIYLVISPFISAFLIRIAVSR